MMINGSNPNLPIRRADAGGPLELPSSSDRKFPADPVDTFELSANASDDGLWKPVVPLFRASEMAAIGNDGMWRPVVPIGRPVRPK